MVIFLKYQFISVDIGRYDQYFFFVMGYKAKKKWKVTKGGERDWNLSLMDHSCRNAMEKTKRGRKRG